MFISVACFSHSPCLLALHLQPCPVTTYSDEEYGRMWAGSNAVGLIGLVLNVYMCMTWSDRISYLLLLSLLCMYQSFSSSQLDHICLVWLCRWLGGKKVFLALPYQLKMCVFAGLLYAIVGTLPSLIMKYDLPCSECNTDEW
jgi:hypothetical protein